MQNCSDRRNRYNGHKRFNVLQYQVDQAVAKGDAFLDDENGLLVENDEETQRLIAEGLAYVDAEGHIYWTGGPEDYD